MQTYSGKFFDLTKFSVEDIELSDIVHALSQICRYTGHCEQFYSVAEHSVYAYMRARDLGLPIDFQKAALLHDAGEAYILDINGVWKKGYSFYGEPIKDLENRILNCVAQKFNFNPELFHSDEVKQLDRDLLYIEKHQVMKGTFDWKMTDPGWTRDIRCLTPEKAEKMFMIYCDQAGLSTVDYAW